MMEGHIALKQEPVKSRADQEAEVCAILIALADTMGCPKDGQKGEVGTKESGSLITPRFVDTGFESHLTAAEAFANRAFAKARGYTGEYPLFTYTLSKEHLSIRKDYNPDYSYFPYLLAIQDGWEIS